MNDDLLFKTPSSAGSGKIFGGFVTLFATLGGAFIIWFANAMTFGEINPEFMHETEPPEGYAYWQRKIFWADFRNFSKISGPAVGITLLPWVTWLRCWKHPQSWRFDLTWGIVSTIGMILPGSVIALSISAQNFHPFLFVPALLLVGCLYSAATSLSRFASRI